MFNKTDIFLVGLGRIGAEHYRAMMALNWMPGTCIGRSKSSCDKFSDLFRTKTISGGLDALLQAPLARAAIVAVSHEELVSCTLALLKKECKYILLEKPGALDKAGLNMLLDMADKNNAKVFVAYNRRFYNSVERLREEIQSDGGILSCHFEFTELEDRVLAEGVSENVLHRWGVVNSTHVIDLAFHLCGLPEKWNCLTKGNLPWHPAGANFAGSGLTTKGILFSYCANWNSAGRWGLEFSTPKRRFFLRPLEELRFQEKGELSVREIELPSEETELKTGFFKQMAAFKTAVESGNIHSSLCSLQQAAEQMPYYEKILGYS